MPLDPQKDIHATTPEGLADYVRKKNSGNGGGKPSGIKEWLRDLFDDCTHGLRYSARLTLGHQRRKVQGEINQAANPEIAAALRMDADKLSNTFSNVVNGGVRGTVQAIHALIKFGPAPAGNDLA